MARAIDCEIAKKRLQAWIDESEAQGFEEAARNLRDCISLLDAVPTLTPPNEPLTIEQLREMDGKPVYMPETNCWALVTQNAFCPILTFPDGEKCSAYDWYEQVGPVYRRPPERQEDT